MASERVGYVGFIFTGLVLGVSPAPSEAPRKPTVPGEHDAWFAQWIGSAVGCVAKVAWGKRGRKTLGFTADRGGELILSAPPGVHVD